MASYNNPILAQITNPVTVDKAIQDLQNFLGSKLSWLSHPFGRAYRNVKENDRRSFYVPEVFISDSIQGRDYFDPRPNDNITSGCFFEVGSSNPVDYTERAYNFYDISLSIIFWANLEKIDKAKASNYHFTEEMIKDVLRVLTRERIGAVAEFQLTINEVQREFDEVFSKYSFGELETQYMKHPYTAFKVNITINQLEECEGQLSDDCQALLQSLDQEDRNECILPTYDFSDDSTFNSLTDQQKEQLRMRYLPDFELNQERDTGQKWHDGRPIYVKVLQEETPIVDGIWNNYISMPHGVGERPVLISVDFHIWNGQYDGDNYFNDATYMHVYWTAGTGRTWCIIYYVKESDLP